MFVMSTSKTWIISMFSYHSFQDNKASYPESVKHRFIDSHLDGSHNHLRNTFDKSHKNTPSERIEVRTNLYKNAIQYILVSDTIHK